MTSPIMRRPRGVRGLLGFLDDAEIWRRLMSLVLELNALYTITDVAGAVRARQTDPDQGFAIVDE